MQDSPDNRLILAITYSDGARATAVLRRLWQALTAKGAACAGIVQRDEPPAEGHGRCDMVLECIASGERLKISDDRGPMARGCRLDVGELVRALEIERQALCAKPDALFVNKFGKTESEGGGFRPLIADAIEQGIPVLLTVPWKNIDSWRLFAGDLAIEVAEESLHPDGDAELLARLGLLPSAASSAATSDVSPQQRPTS